VLSLGRRDASASPHHLVKVTAIQEQVASSATSLDEISVRTDETRTTINGAAHPSPTTTL
jgi:hypothetical protein